MTLPQNFKRLFAMHRPYVGRMLLAFAAMIVGAATEPVAPYSLQLLLDHGFVENPDFSLWLVPLVVIGLIAVRGASIFVSTYMMTWVSTQILNDFRRQMFSRIVALASGRIVEIGTHKDLLQKQGIYASLYRLQFSGEAMAIHE